MPTIMPRLEALAAAALGREGDLAFVRERERERPQPEPVQRPGTDRQPKPLGRGFGLDR